MIRFGMALMEMVQQLTKGFVKTTGRQPDNLEKLKIQQEAVQRFKDMNKVVDMQGRTLDPTKPIMGGTQEGAAIKSGIMKATGAKPKGDKIYGVGGEEIDVADFKKSLGLDEATQKKDMEDLEKKLQMIIGRDRTKHTTGGRAGFKDGMSRRKFMQIMGGLAALPIVGKFFKAGKVAAPAVEAAKETVTQAPSYFFDLVNKIKMFGKEGIPIGPRKRTVNYKNYELTEDISTGDITIVKQKGDPDFAYEEEVMLLRKGQADETTKGRTPPDEYEELTVRPDMEGKMKDVEDGIEPEGIQEIIQEASGEAPSIKKAGGGIARMLGE